MKPRPSHSNVTPTDAQRDIADEIDREIHERLRPLRTEGLIGEAAFYRVSAIVIDVTSKHR